MQRCNFLHAVQNKTRQAFSVGVCVSLTLNVCVCCEMIMVKIMSTITHHLGPWLIANASTFCLAQKCIVVYKLCGESSSNLATSENEVKQE